MGQTPHRSQFSYLAFIKNFSTLVARDWRDNPPSQKKVLISGLKIIAVSSVFSLAYYYNKHFSQLQKNYKDCETLMKNRIDNNQR